MPNCATLALFIDDPCSVMPTTRQFQYFTNKVATLQPVWSFIIKCGRRFLTDKNKVHAKQVHMHYASLCWGWVGVRLKWCTCWPHGPPHSAVVMSRRKRASWSPWSRADGWKKRNKAGITGQEIETYETGPSTHLETLLNLHFQRKKNEHHKEKNLLEWTRQIKTSRRLFIVMTVKK